jgi:biotin carboxylase
MLAPDSFSISPNPLVESISAIQNMTFVSQPGDNLTVLNWKASCRRALETLLPAVAWCQLLRHIREQRDIAALYGFEVVLKPLTGKAYQECCKI